MPDTYRVVIEREIRSRRSTEQWYRQHHWADWSDLRQENAAVLRALLAIRHEVRADERRSETRDPVTAFKGWTESEIAAAFGR